MNSHETSIQTPPDWDKVHFAVSCARCGQDLHGLTEPVCPACRLEFDWAAAVPIEQLTCETCDYHLYGLTETRCPECGTPFTWEEALANYHRNKNPLFEYQWRNRPIKSFFGTWLRTLRPKKFWQSVDIHSTPQIKPLALQAFIAIVFLSLLAPIGTAIFMWIGRVLLTIRAGRSWYTQIQYFPSQLYEEFARIDIYFMSYVSVLWFVCSMLSFSVFKQTLRSANMKRTHIIRVLIYSQILIVPIIQLVFWICAQIYNTSTIVFNFWFLGDSVQPIQNACYTIIIMMVIWSQYQAFRRYLYVPSALATVLVAQVISLLGMATVFFLLVLILLDV